MEVSTTSKRIHPLVAGAACSVILVSLLGAAALTGVLPSSHSSANPAGNTVPAMDNNANLGYSANNASLPLANNVNNTNPPAVNYANTTQNAYAAPAPARVAQSSHHQLARTYTEPARTYHTQPAQAQNSPVGIGVGAVLGGLIGSQVGNGNGRTLATIAGAVGGGYVGNEVAKRNP
ncbi:glycine zipper 2TM domain-containing protein [Undibacterium sp. Di27W]|uniref:glycine zipper 2TM domain-containing protein n=1 Tax=Undibacterium sp. Di27W TaxID=3413036 RepID=UPI003BF16F9C